MSIWLLHLELSTNGSHELILIVVLELLLFGDLHDSLSLVLTHVQIVCLATSHTHDNFIGLGVMALGHQLLDHLILYSDVRVHLLGLEIELTTHEQDFIIEAAQIGVDTRLCRCL